MHAHITAFDVAKPGIVEAQLAKGQLEHFPRLAACVPDDVEPDTFVSVSPLWGRNLLPVSQESGCGLQALYRHLWISRGRRPCPLKVDLVELQSNDELKAKFDNSSPLSFFRDIALSSRNFPKYTVHVQRIVAMLGGTYCYEQLFSKMKYITSLLPSLLSDLQVNDIILLSSSSIEPDTDILIHCKQHQPSHWFACFAIQLQPHFGDFVCDSGPRAAPESIIWPSFWKGCPPLR